MGEILSNIVYNSVETIGIAKDNGEWGSHQYNPHPGIN